MRVLRYSCLILVLVLASACASSQKSFPLQDFAEVKGTFHVKVTTSQLDAAGTFPSIEPVNANVVPAREAILAIQKMGYQYVEYPDQARYRVEINLTCFSPREVALARAQNAALDTLFPDAFSPFDDSFDDIYFMPTNVYIYPVPGRDLPNTCSGRVHMAIWENTGASTELFQGGGFIRNCGFTENCPYDQCGTNLVKNMKELIRKVF